MDTTKNYTIDTTHKFPYQTLNVRAWARTLRPGSLALDETAIEVNWLPAVGPTTMALMRRLGRELAKSSRFPIDCQSWATDLGVGHKGGYHSPFWRAIRRAERFGVVNLTGDELLVRTKLPLSPSQLTT